MMKKMILLSVGALLVVSVYAATTTPQRGRSHSMVSPGVARDLLAEFDAAADAGVRQQKAFVGKADKQAGEAFLTVRQGLAEVDTLVKEAPARLERVKREVEAASKVAESRKQELDDLRKQSADLGRRIHRTFQPYGVTRNDYLFGGAALAGGGMLAYRHLLAQQARKDRMRRMLAAYIAHLRGKHGVGSAALHALPLLIAAGGAGNYAHRTAHKWLPRRRQAAAPASAVVN